MRIALVYAVLVSAFLVVPAVTVAQQADFDVKVVGPQKAGVGSKVDYSIVCYGVYDNYTLYYYIVGENLAGASPTEPQTVESESGKFNVTVTMPSRPQEVEVVFRVLASDGDTHYSRTIRYRVEVVESITFSVVVSNPTNTTIENVRVHFYVDGKYIGNTTASKIAPGANTTVMYTWSVPDIQRGEHTLRVEVEGSATLFNTGQTVYTEEFYYGEEQQDYTWVLYILAFGLFGTAGFILMNGMRRRRAATAVPKWKK